MKMKISLTKHLVAAFAFAMLIAVVGVSAQTDSQKAVADVLRQNATAFEKGDLGTLDKIWANSEYITVFESGHANYGWLDYRNNHLAPEMKEIQITKYALSDIKVKVVGEGKDDEHNH